MRGEATEARTLGRRVEQRQRFGEPVVLRFAIHSSEGVAAARLRPRDVLGGAIWIALKRFPTQMRRDGTFSAARNSVSCRSTDVAAARDAEAAPKGGRSPDVSTAAETRLMPSCRPQSTALGGWRAEPGSLALPVARLRCARRPRRARACSRTTSSSVGTAGHRWIQPMGRPSVAPTTRRRTAQARAARMSQ